MSRSRTAPARRRGAGASVALVVAVLALLAGACGSDDGERVGTRDGRSTPPDEVRLAGPAGEGSVAPAVPTEYVAGDGLPVHGGRAPALRVVPPTAEAVERLAAALGLGAELERDGPGWRATDGTRQLVVDQAGGWAYAASPEWASSSVSSSSGQDEALGDPALVEVGLQVLEAAGLDTSEATDSAATDGRWTQVEVAPEVRGLPVIGGTGHVEVGRDADERAVVLSAWGRLLEVEEGPTLDLLDTAEAVERLGADDGFGTWIPSAPLPAVDVPADGGGSSGSGGSSGVDPGPTASGPTVVTEPSGDAATTTLPTTSAPASTAPTTTPAPVTVTFERAERVLLAAAGADGSTVWLVPGYRLATAAPVDEGGVELLTLAVPDDVVELRPSPGDVPPTEPAPATEPGPTTAPAPAPETTVPATAVPETAVPETAVPESTVPPAHGP